MEFLRKIFRPRSRPGGKGDNQSDPSPNIPHSIISNPGAIDPKDADRHSIHSNTTESSVSSEALTRPESRHKKSLAVKLPQSLSRESGMGSLAALDGTSDESSPKMVLLDLLKKKNASYRSGVQRIINNNPFVASCLFNCKLSEDGLPIQWPAGCLSSVQEAWSSVGLTQLQVSNGGKPSMLVVDSIQGKLLSSIQSQIWNSTCVLVYNLPHPSSKVCFIALNLQQLGSLFLLTVDLNGGKPNVCFQSVTKDFTVDGYDGQGQLFTLTQTDSTGNNFENLVLSTTVESDTYALVAPTGNEREISAEKKSPKEIPHCATKFTFVRPVMPEQFKNA